MKITDAAFGKIAEHVNRNPDIADGMRISIRGGGCSGFQYDFCLSLEEEDDIVIEQNGVRVYIDPISAAYLENAEFDYVEENFSSQFIFRNPSVKSTCGCGSSFSA
jgi:iron-sulfur cluster insertion protein